MRQAIRILGVGVCLILPSVADAAVSRITQVTLYPGSATVERVAQVDTGALQLEVNCLPESFNVQSVRVSADSGIQVGDVRIETVRREHTDKCSNVLEEQIRTLEDQLAVIEAEKKGNALAASYLNSLSQSSAVEKGAQAVMPADARQLGQITMALAQNTKNIYAEQHQIVRRAEVLERQLSGLREELERTGGQQSSNVRTMTVRLKAQRAGQVRIEYHIPRAGWTPAYQASLDFENRLVMIERQAVISQRSGEDWRGVKIRLATGRPDQASAGPVPDRWALGKIDEDLRLDLAEVRGRAMVPMAPAPVAAAARKSAYVEEESGFTVETVQGQFSTVFEVPGMIDLKSGADKLTLSLGSQTVPASVKVRTAPRLQPSAYLVASITTPEGVWPVGEMQLRRNGAFVGTALWNPVQGEQTILPFGRDDLVQVKVIPHKQAERTTGFVGSRVEHQKGITYSILNQHTTAMLFEILEASPVSIHDDIKVHTTFSPQPATKNWQDRPGVIAWEQEIAAGVTASFTAEYLVSYPAGMRITGWSE